jgi:hypothetical protein
MVKVDEYARIRRAHFVDGLGVRAITTRRQSTIPTAAANPRRHP